ncbi:hypothetical protein IF690_27150 [Pseudomonas sp. SK3(2021)]|uniref:hypothetical protein n=1 Tax=Pseudomonas sp. SK3(2021) TaxID=2841064 RepID=UPI00192A74BE|nr:hypothetical protein [Pseudomonas sp. SK3(2021)]QQZ41620.1 hypothetical protein IF690_27150 [Pseudomonas sp. SK3(2021)]
MSSSIRFVRPEFIPDLVVGAPIQFVWKGANCHCGPLEAVTPLLRRLDDTTICGQLTLCTGLLTWAAWRFMGCTDQAGPCLELAEAAFAYQVDWRYTDRSAGTVHTPPNTPPALSSLMEVAVYMWQSLNKDEFWDNYYTPLMQTFHAAHVVQHVMPKAERRTFVHWFDQVIKRVQCHAKAPDDPFRTESDFDSTEAWKAYAARQRGLALPPEIINPQVDYRAEDREQLVARFIANLDWTKNRYLRSPDAMRALGFEGEPYRGDLGRA